MYLAECQSQRAHEVPLKRVTGIDAPFADWEYLCSTQREVEKNPIKICTELLPDCQLQPLQKKDEEQVTHCIDSTLEALGDEAIGEGKVSIGSILDGRVCHSIPYGDAFQLERLGGCLHRMRLSMVISPFDPFLAKS